MSEAFVCQYCGRDIHGEHDMATNKDGSVQPAYCTGCFGRGKLVSPIQSKLPHWIAVDIIGTILFRHEKVPWSVIKQALKRDHEQQFWRARARKLL